MPPRGSPLTRGMLTGVAAYRWLAWGWMATLVLVDRNELEEPGVAVVLRTGIAQSIRARLTSVGGRVEVESRPGRGTEVRLWAPLG